MTLVPGDGDELNEAVAGVIIEPVRIGERDDAVVVRMKFSGQWIVDSGQSGYFNLRCRLCSILDISSSSAIISVT